MFGGQPSEGAHCDHLISRQSTIDAMADTQQAPAVVRVPAALAILQDKKLSVSVELHIDGSLESMVRGKGFDRDPVFIFVQLHHLDPASCVIGNEPVMIE